ncbi:MAG: InlB B-repeat-containing protein, partial [Clostridia bacterium]|nr:InlB B-repeat-containing protein [Clostridia bacterium]
MKKQFLTALMAVCVGGCALGLTACHEHSWGSWTVSETPTQTQSGKATRDCTNDGCKAGAGEKEYILPALTSEDYVKSADSATCSSAGKITYTYNKDGVSLNFDVATQINADAHEYGEWVKTDPAGHYKVCEHNGEHKTTPVDHDKNGTDGACSVCGYKAETSTPTHEHTYSEWVKTDPAGHYKTCTGKNCTDAAGTKYYEDEHDEEGKDGACSVCGYKAGTSTPTHEHTYSEWVKTDPAGHYKTCDGENCTDAAGTKYYEDEHDEDGTDGKCSVCGYKAHEHSWGAWTVTNENIPKKLMPGKATRSCTDKDCNEVDKEEIELPPLASTLEYTLTDNTASCTEGGTATYTYKENTEISFTADTDANGHNYGETAIVDGVPIATCAACGNKLPAPLSGTIRAVMSENPSKEKTTFFAGGDLEYTLTANSGAPGYYTFIYEGEQEITVEYNYYSLKDGEVSGTVTLSGSGKTSLTVNFDDRATCTMKITSSEESAFKGEMSLEFSVNDPSYVMPELSIGLNTVNATYSGVVYEFTALVNGTYTLSCESEDAVILDGTAEELELPYTFTLAKDAKIYFAMCCDDETAEYDVQVALNMQGSGTFSDPYLITEEMIAVNISTIIKNGETKYYKIATDGEFLLNCLPVESGGSYPSFVSDNYTAQEYEVEKVIAEQKITVKGWKVSKISCGEGDFIFALTGSGADATDNVELYLNHVYGSKKNPYNWTYIYFTVDYNSYSAYELGDTVYIDLVPTVTGRVTLNFAHLSNVKINGETVSVDATPFEMFVVKDEKYSIEGTTSYKIDGEECQRESYSITVSSTGKDIAVTRGSSGTNCYENDILMWWRYSEGTSANPHKTVSMLRGDSGSFKLFAGDNSYVRITDTSYVTFTYGDGITASFNGKEILSGVRYAFVAGNKIEFVNSGEASTVSYVLSDSTGDETNPFLLFERRNGAIEVEANSSYYIQTKGAFEMSFTFTGLTVTWNGTEIESGRTYTVALGDTIILTNGGETEVSADYETLALFGTRYNPDTLEVGTAKQVSAERFFSFTLSGDKNYKITAADFATPYITVNGVNNNTLKATSDEYALYATVIQYNNRYYAFNADGVLCETAKNSAGTASQTTAIHYGGSMNGNAYVVTNEGTPLVLSAGTHLIRVLKNPGSSTVLDDMSIDCKITVTEIIVPTSTYTVSFVTNKDGVTVQEQDIEEGQTATEPTAPQCDGFTFIGWFTDADLTQSFDFATPVTEDKILYAKWEPVTPPTPPTPSTDGTETNPYTVQEGVNSGSSTEYNSKVEAYIKYYTYTAET